MDQTVRRQVLLYVEDDPTTSYLFKMAVEELDCRIDLVVVSDGDAAEAFLHRYPPFEDAPAPDLMVLDLNLPGRSGFEILHDIRHDHEFATLPAVVFTSSTRRAHQERALRLGATGFFHKPRATSSFWLTTTQ